MIKKIIFDLDDTLIKWDDRYIDAIKQTVLQYNVDADYLKLNELVDKYEKYYKVYSKENMLNLFNKELNLNLDMSFMDSWLNRLGHMAFKNQEIIDTIKYLSGKYSLVVLTNFLSDVQKNRLKTAGLYDFFDEIIGGEEVIKPNKESFLKACGSNNPSECIMIGDNIEVDIKGALNAGFDAILIDSDDKYKSTNYKRIRSIIELREML